MSDKKDIDIRPSIHPSDKEFREKVGIDEWEKIKSRVFRDSGFKCSGCGFEPYDVSAEKVLDIHLEKEEELIEDSKFKTLCKLCHIIEHADIAIQNEFILLVNSQYKQGELVNICRNGVLSDHINNGSIRLLKKTMTEFLEEVKNGKALEGKVKFIFTEKYLSKFEI